MGGHGFQRHQTQRKASSLTSRKETKQVITRQGTAHRLTGSPASLNGQAEVDQGLVVRSWVKLVYTWFTWVCGYVGLVVIVGFRVVCLGSVLFGFLVSSEHESSHIRPGMVEIPAKCMDIPQFTCFVSFVYFIGFYVAYYLWCCYAFSVVCLLFQTNWSYGRSGIVKHKWGIWPPATLRPGWSTNRNYQTSTREIDAKTYVEHF